MRYLILMIFLFGCTLPVEHTDAGYWDVPAQYLETPDWQKCQDQAELVGDAQCLLTVYCDYVGASEHWQCDSYPEDTCLMWIMPDGEPCGVDGGACHNGECVR